MGGDGVHGVCVCVSSLASSGPGTIPHPPPRYVAATAPRERGSPSVARPPSFFPFRLTDRVGVSWLRHSFRHWCRLSRGSCLVSDIVADRTRFDGNKWTSTPSPSFYEVFGSFHSETCARINDGTVMRETRIRRSVLSTRSKRSKAYKFAIQFTRPSVFPSFLPVAPV